MTAEAKPWDAWERYQEHKARFIQGKRTPSILEAEFTVKDDGKPKAMPSGNEAGRDGK